jgi:hypothetical protein
MMMIVQEKKKNQSKLGQWVILGGGETTFDRAE